MSTCMHFIQFSKVVKKEWKLQRRSEITGWQGCSVRERRGLRKYAKLVNMVLKW